MNKLRVAAFFLIIMCATMLSACNTMQGVGKDVEDAGEAIQKSAE